MKIIFFPKASQIRLISILAKTNSPNQVLISFLTPYATDGIAYNYGYVFVGCNIAGAFVIYFFLYEPAGLTLENVDLMYSQPGLKPWKSRAWTPPGYTTRKIKDEKRVDQHSDNGMAPSDKPETRDSDKVGVEHRV